MKPRLLLSTLVILSIASSANGQTLQKLLSTDNQNLIELATRGCFGTVRQEFQLQDPNSDKKYNLDSLDYFGYAESICIRTTDGLIVSKSLAEPWLVDTNISDYPEYKPKLSAFSIYDPESKDWKRMGIIAPSSVRDISVSEKMIVRDSLFMSTGFQIDSVAGEKDGWILWLKKDGTNISITPLKHKITLADSCETYPVTNIVDGKDYVFGVFVTTDFSTPGSIIFNISAIVEKFSDGWKAIPIARRNEQEKEEHQLVEVIIEQPSPNQIQPIMPPIHKKRK